MFNFRGVDFAEMEGSGHVEYGDGRCWITCIYQVTWKSRLDAVRVLLGWVEQNAQGVPKWMLPHQCPHVSAYYCMSADMEGLDYNATGVAAGDDAAGTLGVNQEILIGCRKAKIVARYRQDYNTHWASLLSQQLYAEETDRNPFAEEDVEFSGSFQAVADGTWEDAGGDTIKFPYYKFIGTSERTIVMSRSIWNTAMDGRHQLMRGKVNSEIWHDQPVGTVLYAGCSLTREINLDWHHGAGRVLTYRATYKYLEQSHSFNSVWVGGTLTPITDGAAAPYLTWTNTQMDQLLQGIV